MTDIINLLKPLIEAPLKYINETDDEFKARITEKFMADNRPSDYNIDSPGED